jgi:D-3-phosphoglycerate dehydrogenase
VIGLGAIGVEVANAALGLRMKVLGYDPQITVQRAWQLSSGVEQALSLDDLFARSDMITVHVPLMDATRALVNESRLRLMKRGGVVLNFARAPIVDEQAMLAALDRGASRPTSAISRRPPPRTTRRSSRCRTSAHRPARPRKTAPMMVADTLRDFLENGNVRHCVNFPRRCCRAPAAAASRSRTPMCRTWSARSRPVLAEEKLNIADLLNKSRGDIAYT